MKSSLRAALWTFSALTLLSGFTPKQKPGLSYFTIAHALASGHATTANAKPFIGKHVVWTGWVRAFRQRKEDHQFEVMLNMRPNTPGKVYPVLIVLPPKEGKTISHFSQKVRFSATIKAIKTDFGFLTFDFKDTQLL
ncbi:MAG TPA: hypothetical protein V6D47_00715 [Oscillatoriaceae cyanobacterium]